MKNKRLHMLLFNIGLLIWGFILGFTADRDWRKPATKIVYLAPPKPDSIRRGVWLVGSTSWQDNERRIKAIQAAIDSLSRSKPGTVLYADSFNRSAK